MSELVVIGFDNTLKADEVLWRLRALRRKHLLDLEDAVVVVRDKDGEIHLRQSINLTAISSSSGLLSGSILGVMVGLLFLNPTAGLLIGSAAGAGAGALSGALDDYGIDDEFIQSLAKNLPANSSALFILVREAQPEKVLAELSDVHGTILQTSLPPDLEQKLREALAGSGTERT
jgi:uncharacterized membrane protein